MKLGTILTPQEKAEIRDTLFKTPQGDRFEWTSWEREVFAGMDDPKVKLILVSVPRGYGKTTVMSVIAGTELLDKDVELHIGASDKKQARRVKSYIGKMADRDADLRGWLDVQSDQVLCKRSGSTATIHESNPSVLGLGGLSRRLVIMLDECAIMGEDVWGYYATAAAKSPSSKIVLCSTAGPDASGWFDSLVREFQEDTSGMAVIIHLSGKDLEPPKWVSGGVVKFIAGLIHGSARDRFFYNKPAGQGNSFFSGDWLNQIFSNDVSFRDTCNGDGTAKHYTGIDLAYRRDWAAVVTIGVHTYGVELEKLRVWKPTKKRDIDLNEIKEYLSTLPEDFNRHKFVADPFQAQAMLQELSGRGFAVQEFPFSAQSKIILARNFYQAVRDRLFKIPIDAEELRSEMERLIVIEKDDFTFTFDHRRKGNSDLSTALALAIMEIPGQPGHRKKPRLPSTWLDRPEVMPTGEEIVENIAARISGVQEPEQIFNRFILGANPRAARAGPPIHEKRRRRGSPKHGIFERVF